MWALEGDLGAWDPFVRGVALIAGLFLLTVTSVSIVRTMVIPRASISWIYAALLRITDFLFFAVARMLPTWSARDRVLSWCGPVSIIFALIVWLCLFLAAYALVIFGITDASLPLSVLEAGSGLFTLGIVGTPSDDVTVIDFIAAMTGPAVIALLIGFLPTLYQSYLTRESRVLLETNLSGAPAWGPEFLARTALVGDKRNIPELLGSWNDWAAQVRLTQTLYPVLNRFRSAVGTRNWVISLISVLDAAILEIAIRKEEPDPDTVMMIQQGTQVILVIDATEVAIDQTLKFRSSRRRLAEMLHVFGVVSRDPSQPRDPSPLDTFLPTGMQEVAVAVTLDNVVGRATVSEDDLLQYDLRLSTLSREDVGKALDYLRSAGIAIERPDDEVFDIFRRMRGRYETAAYHLAQRFYVTPAPWSGPRDPEVPVMWPTLAATLKKS